MEIRDVLQRDEKKMTQQMSIFSSKTKRRKCKQRKCIFPICNSRVHVNSVLRRIIRVAILLMNLGWIQVFLFMV